MPPVVMPWMADRVVVVATSLVAVAAMGLVVVAGMVLVGLVIVSIFRRR